MPRLLPPDHPQRYPMTLELHARPFPTLRAPCEAIHLALTPRDDADRDALHEHLHQLVARFGGPPPREGGAHYYGELGRVRLKWERHTEFVTYTFFQDGHDGAPFALPLERIAPQDWLRDAPGALVAAVRLHVEAVEENEPAQQPALDRLAPHFVAESLAASVVGGGQAAVMGDFRIHEDGFTRFAVLAAQHTGARRLGRVAQRLIEIETYRMMAMLALPVAREMGPTLDALETRLGALTAHIAEAGVEEREALAELTRLSAEIETIASDTAYRFAGSAAYAALVEQRIDVLGERRFANRQLMSEFMARRFLPAMRTCEAARRRLSALTDRASRAAALLSARVNVAVETQNQHLLESMNRRAELQLRLQHTVEGLSVVAVSYYALGLLGYALKPLAKRAGAAPEMAQGLAAIPVVLLVWWLLRRVKRRLGE